MSRIQRWLVGIVTLAILLIAALAIVPPLLNWNAYRDKIETAVSDAIGRETRISGDLTLSLLPRPSFGATGLSVANREGGESPHLAAVDRLQVELRLAPLLRGAIEVERLVLERPAIALERFPDGSGNWELASSEDGAGSGDSGAPGAAVDEESGLPDVKLERFLLVDGIVSYRDLGSDAPPRTLRIAEAELTTQSLLGPFGIDGQLSIGDVSVALQAEVGEIVEGGSTAFAVQLDLGRGAAEGEVRGRFVRPAEVLEVSAQIEAEAPDLARALALLGVPPRPLTAVSFAVSADIEGSSTGAKAGGLRIVLGETSAEGTAEVIFGPPLTFKTALNTTHLDLDELLAAAAPAAPASQADAPASGDGVAPEEHDFALPTEIGGAVALSVDALVYRGQVVRQARLDAQLSDGEIRLERALALLPGGGDIGLSGRVTAEKGEPRFRGHLEAAADNLRGTLAWLGVDLSRVPADRLRKATISTAIDASPRSLTLNSVDLRFDTTRATGGLALALRDRPAFGLGLTLDRLNLDAYLPRGGDAGGSAEDGPAEAASAASSNGAGVIDWANAFDANLDIKLRQLTYRGETANDLALEATLDRGRLMVRRAAVGDFAGAQALFSGAVEGLASSPAIDGRVTFRVPEPQRLARAAGADNLSVEALGPLEVDGTVKGSLAGADIDLQALALDGDLKAVGRVTPLAAPATFDLALELNHPDLAKLARRFSDRLRVDPAVGDLSLKTRLVGTSQEFALENLVGQAGPIRLSGQVKVRLDGPRPAIVAALETSELPMAVFAAPAVDGGTSDGNGGKQRSATSQERWSHQPLDLSALKAVDLTLTLEAAALTHEELKLEQVKAEAELADGVLTVSQFAASLYGGQLTASGSLDARTRPALALDLTAERLQLERLVPALPLVGTIKGPLDIMAELSSSGLSEAGLVSALEGGGQLSGTVEIPKGSGAVPAIGALSALLQDKVRETGGLVQLADAPLRLLGGGADLSGTFTVTQGVARTDDTRLDGKSGAEALLIGEADLPRWLLDAELAIARTKGAEPDLVLAARGPLDQPDVRLRGTAIGDRPLVDPAPGGSPSNSAQPGGEQQRRRLTPQEIIEKGLKGLLPGLE